LVVKIFFFFVNVGYHEKFSLKTLSLFIVVNGSKLDFLVQKCKNKWFTNPLILNNNSCKKILYTL